MAQYRQSGGLYYPNGSSDHISIGVRGPPQHHHKPGRIRRVCRSDKSNRFALSIGSVIVFSCFILLVTVLAYYFLSSDNNTNSNNKEASGGGISDDDLYFLTNVTRTDAVKVLGFGQGSGKHGRDSRYWDRDDRRRDDDYDEDDVERVGKASGNDSVSDGGSLGKGKDEERKTSRDKTFKSLDQRGVGLYNEDGRNELKMYEAEYEASLKDGGHLRRETGSKSRLLEDEDFEERHEVVDTDNEYDDGIDFHDAQVDDYDNSENVKVEHSDEGLSNDENDRVSSNSLDAEMKVGNITNDVEEDTVDLLDNGSSNSKSLDKRNTHYQHVQVVNDQSTTKPRSDSKKKSKRRKFSGSSCETKFLNSTSKLVEPFESRKFARFSLQYVEMEEKPNGKQQWEPRFAGHQSLAEREESFLAHDQKIKCGFIKGPEGSFSTGFDLSEDDSNYISRCHIAVSSCIFGNSDRLRSPAVKMVTRLSRKNVCFVMFVDEITLQTLSSEGHTPDREGFIGLWKIVVVKNLPYSDMRRVGKIPKLLPHRLFPSARYSMWLDSKLRLQLDPLLVLEYLLWRKGHEYAISNHYDRHCVWEEVAQNKRLNKYDPTVIDQQFSFYRSDGLKRFNASEPNKLLPSNVPEGSLIVRAHTPMSNLFSCLWFNEVDRFTPRDQLSFAYTYHKLRRMNPEKPFYLNMFKDCERRQIAKLFRHRSEEKRSILRRKAAE